MKHLKILIISEILLSMAFADESWITFEYFPDKQYSVEVELFHQESQKLVMLKLDSTQLGLNDSIQRLLPKETYFLSYQ